MITEKEARTKWCPFARVSMWFEIAKKTVGAEQLAQRFAVSVNRAPETVSGISEQCKCVGSECMAWRFLEKTTNDGEPDENSVGFCGLAGKP